MVFCLHPVLILQYYCEDGIFDGSFLFYKRKLLLINNKNQSVKDPLPPEREALEFS